MGIGCVNGRRLTFDKVSKDGSGKCDAEETGVETNRVHGVLFEILKSEKRALDKAEGVGKGYCEKAIEVDTPNGKVTAITYIATIKEPGVCPYTWYKALVVAGAVEHGLPGDYVEWIKTFETQDDPCLERRAKNEATIC
jgi:cation transport regulator ChaC